MVVALVLPMTCDLANHSRQFFTICKNSATIAIATQGLAWEEAGARYGGQITGFRALITGAEALGGVFNHREPVL